MRQNKQLGLSRAQEYELELNKDDKIYDVVDEEKYKEIKRKRKREGAFVVDDDGTGYLDNYEEDHYFRHEENDEEFSNREEKRKPSKSKKKIGEFHVNEQQANTLNEMFTRVKKNKSKLKSIKLQMNQEKIAEEELETELENLDGGSDAGDEFDFPQPSVLIEQTPVHESMSIDYNVDVEDDAQESKKKNKDHERPEAETDFQRKKRLVEEEKVRKQEFLSNLASKPIQVIEPTQPDIDIETLVSSPIDKTKFPVNDDVFYFQHEKNKVMKVFIYDIYEDKYKMKLYLFCKALENNEKKQRKGIKQYFKNICIEVTDIVHTLYFLPKPEQTDEIVIKEMFQYMNTLVSKEEVIKHEFLEREYWFSHQLPEEERKFIENGSHRVLKVSFPIKFIKKGVNKNKMTKINEDVFRKVFNLTQSLTENFILNKCLKGPSFFHVVLPTKLKSNISWTAAMYSCHVSKLLKPPTKVVFKDPSFSIMSISMKVVLNKQRHLNEIYCITVCYKQCVQIESKVCPFKEKGKARDLKYFTFMNASKLKKSPGKLKENEKQKNSLLFVHRDEKELLTHFVKVYNKLDPDILASHGLLSFDLSLLLDRLTYFKIRDWSSILRLRLSKLNKYNRTRMIGRLAIDIEVSAKELMLGQKNYTMENLVQKKLGMIAYKGYTGDELNDRGVSVQDIQVILEKECFYNLLLIDYMGILLLTKNVSNLCGNLWNRTLSSGRSERIEYLLLHELHDKGNVLLPEKVTQRDSKKKKEKYSGGLVLEPKKGLYNKNIILLLDYNSLYPSIIQEFNYCFSLSQEEGILPKQLKILVSRRNEIKRLLKMGKVVGTERDVLDIRQKALKIIANSIYGCLGFSGSRFYAQSIAENVTKKGRELLQEAVNVVESQFGLQVLYGDTDSIMIQTPFSNNIIGESGLDKAILDKVSSLSKQVRKKVNSNYKKIELGEDGMFLSLLLLRKKKYAALALQKTRIEKEVKGLDMVRRDWCLLTKKVSNQILDVLLNKHSFHKLKSAKENEASLQSKGVEEQIIDILDVLQQEIKEESQEAIKKDSKFLRKYLITKGLNKKISEYKNNKGLPHVEVAARLMKKGKKVKVGDYIPYFHAKTEDNEEVILHPSELTKDKKVFVNFDYYISQQLLPPIERLLKVVEEVNMDQIYSLFNIKKSLRKASGLDDSEIIRKKEDFSQCERLKISCLTPNCAGEITVSNGTDLNEMEKQMQRLQGTSGEDEGKPQIENKCLKCGEVIDDGRIYNCCVLETKKMVQKYYLLQDEIESKQLYVQMKYFASLLGTSEKVMYEERFVKRNSYNFIKSSIFTKAFGLTEKSII